MVRIYTIHVKYSERSMYCYLLVYLKWFIFTGVHSIASYLCFVILR